MKKIILGNVYSPTRDKEQIQCKFFSELDRVISSLAADGYRILIGGDFNVIMNMALDYFGSRTSDKKLRVGMWLMGILEKFDLVDIWRKRIRIKNNLHLGRKTQWFKLD